MKVHETSYIERPPHTASEAQKVQQKSKKAAAPVDHESEAPDAAAPQTPEKTRGVIRLLEEGHFKGVADVRLRINFFDELSSRAHHAAQPVVDEQTAKLSDAVATKIEETIAALEVDDATKEAIGEAVAAFDSALQDGVATFKSQNAGGADALVASFQTQIDTLIANLSDLLIPQVDKTPASSEPIAASEPTTDATTPDTTTPENVPDVTAQDALADTTLPASIPDATGSTAPAADPISTIPEIPEGQDGIDVAPFEITNPVEVYTDALTAIRASAEGALAELKASLTGALDLGEPSKPGGNGGAYDKFLAIYQELLGVRPSVDERV